MVKSRRTILFLTLIVIGLSIVDFSFYLREIWSKDNALEDVYDCVVVLSGRHERVTTGIERYEKIRVRKLLLSGVKAGTNKYQRQDIKEDYPEFFDCCIEFGWGAKDTIGNGIETASWVRKSKCTSLTLVTDDYHMPRAFLVFQQYVELDNISTRKIQFSKDGSYLSIAYWRVVCPEYGKFVWMRALLAWRYLQTVAFA